MIIHREAAAMIVGVAEVGQEKEAGHMAKVGRDAKQSHEAQAGHHEEKVGRRIGGDREAEVGHEIDIEVGQSEKVGQEKKEGHAAEVGHIAEAEVGHLATIVGLINRTTTKERDRKIGHGDTDLEAGHRNEHGHSAMDHSIDLDHEAMNVVMATEKAGVQRVKKTRAKSLRTLNQHQPRAK
jgi:hypothetical protein